MSKLVRVYEFAGRVHRAQLMQDRRLLDAQAIELADLSITELASLRTGIRELEEAVAAQIAARPAAEGVR